MANLATINNNLLADSGIDPLSVVLGSGTANQIAYWIDADNIGALTTATYPSLTELSYVKGVTSAIQTQIDGKLSLSGGTMTGNINWAQTDRGIVWAFNTDGAYIKFYNTGDGDTDSRLEFATIDNNNEYFRWGHVPSGGSFYESMKLVPVSSGNAELTVSGKIIKAGGTSSQYLMADGSVSTLTNPVTGTGSNNYISKFTTTGSTIGNSLMYESGNTIVLQGASSGSFNIRAQSSGDSYLFFTESGIADRYLIGSYAGNGDLVFRSNSYSFGTGTERMRLTAAGVLSIGTDSPYTSKSELLYVGYEQNNTIGTGDAFIGVGAKAGSTNKAGINFYVANGNYGGRVYTDDTLNVIGGLNFDVFNNSTPVNAMNIARNGRILVNKIVDDGNQFQVNGSVSMGALTGTAFDFVLPAASFTSYSYGTDLTVNTGGGWARAHRIYNTVDTTKIWFIGVLTYDTFYINFGDPSTVSETGYVSPKFTISSAGAGTFVSSVTASSIIKSGGTASQYLMADGSVSTLTNPVTGTGTTNRLAKFTGTSTIGDSIISATTNIVTINGTDDVVPFRVVTNVGTVTRIGFGTLASANSYNVSIGAHDDTSLGFWTADTLRGYFNSSGSLVLTSNTITTTFHPSSTWFARSYKPTLANGASMAFVFGKTDSAKNSATILYNHVADDSGSNSIGLGLYSSDNQLKVYSNGDVDIVRNVTADKLIKSGGTSSQYLMADGSVSTLTNPVTGTGTAGYLPKWTSTSAIGNSILYETGSKIYLGTTTTNTISTGGLTLSNATSSSLVLYNGGIVGFLYGSSIAAGVALTADKDLRFETGDGSGTNWPERARLYQLTGNFSLGYGSSPADSGYKLDVNGTVRFAGALTGTSAAFSDTVSVGNPSTWAILQIKGSSSTQGGQVDFYGGATRYALIAGEYESATNGVLKFRTLRSGTMSEAMTVFSTGIVSIGTITPYTSKGELLYVGDAQNSATTGFVDRFIGVGAKGGSGAKAGINLYVFNGNYGGRVYTDDALGAIGGLNFDVFNNSTPVNAMNITRGGRVLVNKATDDGNQFQVNGSVSMGALTGTAFNFVLPAASFTSYSYGTDLTVNTGGGWARAHRIYNTVDTTKMWFIGVLSFDTFYIKFGNPATVDQTGYAGVGMTISSSGIVSASNGTLVGLSANGTSGRIPKFTATNTIADSMFEDGGAGVGYVRGGADVVPLRITTTSGSVSRLGFGTASSSTNYSCSIGATSNNNLGFWTVDILRGYFDTSGNLQMSYDIVMAQGALVRMGGDTRYGVAKIYNASVGDMFGMEQVGTTQTGTSGAATRIFAANSANNFISLGWYTNATSFTDALKIVLTSGDATFVSKVTAQSFFEGSDRRIKDLVEDNYRANGIELIKSRLYKKNGKIELGYYAQDVEPIMQHAIYVNEDGYLMLSYREVHTAKIAYLEDSVDEIRAKILYLENQLKQIKNENN